MAIELLLTSTEGYEAKQVTSNCFRQSTTDTFRPILAGGLKKHIRAVFPHLVLVVVVVSQPLAVLVQLAHKHLPCAEIKSAEVHLVTKVTG